MKQLIKNTIRALVSVVPVQFKNAVPTRLKKIIHTKVNYLPRTVVIDIVGSCNIGCPSCPSGGNIVTNRGGKMSFEMFDKILQKVSREEPGTTIALFNWTEPLIHPQVCDFIKATRQYGLKSRISSNLNILKDPEKLAAANPDGMTISLSGFTQDIYTIGHKQGNIETVKKNMKRLSQALTEAKSTTEVTVYYHTYLHNRHEIPLMKAFAESLGFNFGSGWAYYMPIERTVALLKNELTDDETHFVDNYFALNIRQAITEAKKYKEEPCEFYSTLLTIDCRGNVQLCCSVYDASRFTVGSYIDTPTDVIAKKLKQHSYCSECASHGLHVYTSWHSHDKLSKVYEKIAQDECEKYDIQNPIRVTGS